MAIRGAQMRPPGGEKLGRFTWARPRSFPGFMSLGNTGEPKAVQLVSTVVHRGIPYFGGKLVPSTAGLVGRRRLVASQNILAGRVGGAPVLRPPSRRLQDFHQAGACPVLADWATSSKHTAEQTYAGGAGRGCRAIPRR